MTSEEQASPFSGLTALLEFEITRIREEQKTPGWTMWALIGAVAAIAWLSLKEVENRPPNVSHILFACLVLHLCWIQIMWIALCLSPMKLSTGKSIRFWLSNIYFGHGRAYLFVNILRYSVLMVIAATNPLMPNDAYSYFVYLLLIMLVVICLVVIILSITDIPIPNTSIKSDDKLSKVFFIIVSLIIIAIPTIRLSLIFASQTKLGLLSISSIKMGMLLVSAIILLSLLTKPRIYVPLLETLVDIRRKIGLKEAETSIKQIDRIRAEIESRLSIQESNSASRREGSEHPPVLTP